ncbi:hypothetical protein DRQ53_04475 [bacterium]|nr:MAG: hypothetical protein DRQ32_07230 [bacterium]RKZ17090.1 MAG: hypothetical protein DRQ53_04475 [bacterium]
MGMPYMNRVVVFPEGSGTMLQGGQSVVEKDQALVKEKPFVKYEQLIEKAETEGRIDGPHRCIVCGMRYMEKDSAEDCCRAVLEAGNV